MKSLGGEGFGEEAPLPQPLGELASLADEDRNAQRVPFPLLSPSFVDFFPEHA